MIRLCLCTLNYGSFGSFGSFDKIEYGHSWSLSNLKTYFKLLC